MCISAQSYILCIHCDIELKLIKRKRTKKKEKKPKKNHCVVTDEKTKIAK